MILKSRNTGSTKEYPAENLTFLRKYINKSTGLTSGRDMKKHILIIDDDKAMCQLLEKMLVKNYLITSKYDGVEAMQWMMDGVIPDLIITDVEMPSLDGVEFLKNLKNSSYYSDVPIIVISGYDSKEQKLKCLKYGAYEYFVKPFNPRDLLFTIEIVLKLNQEKLNIL